MQVLAQLIAQLRIARRSLTHRYISDQAFPARLVFTRQHYSFSRINGTRPLPAYPSNDKATDAQKAAVFNTLYLNSGTYTATGNTLATKAMMAKSKFAIGGAGNQYEFTIAGNSLTLTQKPSGAMLKLTRLE